MLVFAFNTVAVVALIIAVSRIHRGLNNIWRSHVVLCRKNGVSFMGYWEGVDESKVEDPSRKPRRRRKPKLRKVA